MSTNRDDRFSKKKTAGPRSAYEVDGDRILYCDGFRRLAGVTQVIWPQDQQVIHTRLTHTLEVSQLSRRIAQNLRKKYPKEAENINPDVTAAAAYAHDIGHPPFGHIGERTLNTLIQENTGYREGFDANAQSFRMVTKLAQRKTDEIGLDLTRATINALMKYPWFEATPKAEAEGKFGAYQSEREYYEWARKGISFLDEPVLEAQIMNVADDIAYTVHDILDFVRVGVLPIHFLYFDRDVLTEFLEVWGQQNKEKSWPRDEDGNLVDPVQVAKASKEKNGTTVFHRFLEDILTSERVLTKKKPRAFYMQIASQLINLFVPNVYIARQGGRKIVKFRDVLHDKRPALQAALKKEPERSKRQRYRSIENQIRFFKQIPLHYLFHHARLSSVQEGQAQVISTLFDKYCEALKEWKSKKEAPAIIPARVQSYIEKVIRDGGESMERLTADIICSLTDHEAYELYWRMTGVRIPTIGEISVM